LGGSLAVFLPRAAPAAGIGADQWGFLRAAVIIIIIIIALTETFPLNSGH